MSEYCENCQYGNREDGKITCTQQPEYVEFGGYCDCYIMDNEQLKLENDSLSTNYAIIIDQYETMRTRAEKAEAEVERWKIQAEIAFYDHEIAGVMHSVDKWFDEVDETINPSTRACHAREIALKAIEFQMRRASKAEAEVERLRLENEQYSKRFLVVQENEQLKQENEKLKYTLEDAYIYKQKYYEIKKKETPMQAKLTEYITNEDGHADIVLSCPICGDTVGIGLDEDEETKTQYNIFGEYCAECGQRICEIYIEP